MVNRYQKFHRTLLETVVFMSVGTVIGWVCGPALSRMHPVVKEAEKVFAHEEGRTEIVNFEVEAFRIEGVPMEMLFSDARDIRGGFKTGGALFGAWVGLVIGLSLGSVRLERMGHDYEADPALCVSCGRCYMSCPVEHRRLGLLGKIRAARQINPDNQEDEV